MVQKEVRLGSPLFFFFAFLNFIFCYSDESFFSLAYANVTFLVVLNHARDTKFVVENFFESSHPIFLFIMKEINM